MMTLCNYSKYGSDTVSVGGFVTFNCWRFLNGSGDLFMRRLSELDALYFWVERERMP